MPDFLHKISDGEYYSLRKLKVLTGIPLSQWQDWTRVKKIKYMRVGHRGKKYILGSVVKEFLKENTVGQLSNV